MEIEARLQADKGRLQQEQWRRESERRARERQQQHIIEELNRSKMAAARQVCIP